MPPPIPRPANKPISISLGTKKGGPSKTSLSFKPSPNPRPNSIAVSKKRPHSSLAESDSEDDTSHTAQPTLVSGFDHAAGGAIHIDGPREAKKALVIQGPKNKDWREESRRRRGGGITGNGEKLPHEVAAEMARNARTVGDGEGDVLNNGPQAFGLTFVEAKNSREDVVMVDTVASTDEVTVDSVPRKAKTEDEIALEALTGDGTARRSDLVLPALGTQNGSFIGRVTNGINEDDAFRIDLESRPDSSTLDDYAAVPVEEFGAALLRGMGWKEGDVVGKRKDQVSKARVVERRPALLGIGAKEVPGAAEELGAWGKSLSAKGKKGRKTQEIYTPVVLRDSVTGEMVTEEDLKERREGAKKGEDDWRERRDRNLERDRERKGGREGDSQLSRRRSQSPKRKSDLDDRRERRRERDREHGERRQDRDRERNGNHYDSSSSKHSRSDGDYRNGNRDRDRERHRERAHDENRRRDGGHSRTSGSSRREYRIDDAGRRRQEPSRVAS